MRTISTIISFFFAYNAILSVIVLHWYKDTDEIFYVSGVAEVFDNDGPAKNKINTRPICPDTKHLFTSIGDLESAFKELEQFHNGGGNLKTIETFLNEQMDPTLKLLGVTFTPNGSNDPIPPDKSTIKTIKKLFAKGDKNKRGGYDQRKIPGTYTSDPNMRALRGQKFYHFFDAIEPDKQARWKKGLGPIPNICRRVDKVYFDDGGKEMKNHGLTAKMMCSYPGLNPESGEGKSDANHSSTAVELNQNEESNNDSVSNGASECAFMSMGSNREWGFERSVAQDTNCTAHTFDCTTADSPMKPDADSIHYYPYCISNEYKKIDDREYLTYFDMLQKIGLTKAPDLLKMDVEGFEFDILTQMLDHTEQTNSKHLLPAQISIELHYATRMYDLPWHLRFRQTAEIAMFAGMMYNRGGYVLTNIELFKRCPSCAEVIFVRAFCDTRVSS